VLTPRFPDRLAYGATGGPGFKTTIGESRSGVESRNIDWSAARAQYAIDLSLITDRTRLLELISFFNNAKGRGHSFRFKDHRDYFSGSGETSSAEAIGTGDGVSTAFQLKKTYSITGSSYVRNITKPVQGTLQVFKAGVLQTETTHYTVDYSTGIVTFLAAPSGGQAITAIYEFDVPVRFDQDDLGITIEAHNVFASGSISLVEVIGE
jgi:uncharacterized protein (TIGR02217 family)